MITTYRSGKCNRSPFLQSGALRVTTWCLLTLFMSLGLSEPQKCRQRPVVTGAAAVRTKRPHQVRAHVSGWTTKQRPFHVSKMRSRKPRSRVPSKEVGGWPTALWGPDPPPCQATATAAVKRTLVDLASLDVSTAVNDNTNRPLLSVLPARASCRLPTCVYVLGANAAAALVGSPCWSQSAETPLSDSSAGCQQQRLLIVLVVHVNLAFLSARTI